MSRISIQLLNFKEIEAKLNALPIEAAHAAMGDIEDYLLNVMRSDQPPPNYVTRKAAYGQTFQSDKQRRWFFATHEMPYQKYRRTQALSKGWHIVDRGLTGYLVNYTKGASYVVGERNQSRHEALVGWKKASQQIADRIDKINKIMKSAADKTIRKLGLK